MQKFIGKDETLIKGKDVFENGKWIATDSTLRVQYLRDNFLKKVTSNSHEWTTLYIDESDRRYWELFYSEANWKDMGSPSLRFISEAEAKEKYKL